MLPLELLQILACPACKGAVTLSEDGTTLHCQPCRKDYPVVGDIPVMFSEQTRFTF